MSGGCADQGLDEVHQVFRQLDPWAAEAARPFLVVGETSPWFTPAALLQLEGAKTNKP